MSDFDKKKPNIKSDTEEIYEIPDIVTGGKYTVVSVLFL